MKKYFLIILICTISFPAFSQGGTKLYKNLIEGMPIKEARKLLKKIKLTMEKFLLEVALFG